jgi:hypothetical protein
VSGCIILHREQLTFGKSYLCVSNRGICPKVVGYFVVNMRIINPFVDIVKCFSEFFIIVFFDFF